MRFHVGWPKQRIVALRMMAGLIAGILVLAVASLSGALDHREDLPEAEFHMVRVKYRTSGFAGSHGIPQPWWAIDYPYAEQHFLPALARVTNLWVAEDSRHLDLMDDRIFDYPFLFMQQPGRGNWRPTKEEAERLREHLLRGGFLLVDDLHGDYDWAVFQRAMSLVFPDRPIVEIPENDAIMHVFFDLDQRVQIPGLRHLYGGQMAGPPHWRGIYDDRNRLMVAINFNMDMGDAWEHADDPNYPVPMTKLAYQLGTNYIIYAMTH